MSNIRSYGKGMPDENNKQYGHTNGLTKFIIHLTSSAIAGVIAKSVVAPFDRIKIILQTREAGSQEKYGALLPNLPKNKKTIQYTVNQILHKQGFFGLWRGNWSNIVRYVPAQSLLFGFHKFFISLLTDEDINNLSPLKVAQISMIAGGISSSCTLTLTYQLYLCQTLIAAYRGRPEDAKYSTVFGCLRRVYLKEGIRGTFTGFYMSQAFVITSRTLYFGLYDTIKSFHLPMYNLPPTFVKFLYAQTTTLIASFVAYPMETISRRLILEAGLKRKVYHGDSIKCIKVLYREEGIKGFFAGGLTNMIRSVGGAIVLVLHEDFSRRAVKWIELHKH